jgi:hypothetical protein
MDKTIFLMAKKLVLSKVDSRIEGNRPPGDGN